MTKTKEPETKSPRVSVVMAAYNEESCLERAAQSVLEQSYDNLELIVVDDASTDATSEILRSLAARDNRVRAIGNETNQRLPRALNIGIARAQGEWIARIDADDTWETEKLEIQMDYLEAHPDVGIIGTWALGHNEKSDTRAVLRMPVSHEEILRHIWRACPIFHSSVVVRRDLLDPSGPYNPAYSCAQDYDLWFRVVHQTRAHNIPLPLVVKTTHRDQSITYADWKKTERQLLSIKWRNLRERRPPLSKYGALIPTLLRLCLPAGAKRAKQRLMQFLGR